MLTRLVRCCDVGGRRVEDELVADEVPDEPPLLILGRRGDARLSGSGRVQPELVDDEYRLVQRGRVVAMAKSASSVPQDETEADDDRCYDDCCGRASGQNAEVGFAGRPVAWPYVGRWSRRLRPIDVVLFAAFVVIGCAMKGKLS